MIQIKKEVHNTHFFVYKNEKYPFNLELFKLCSNYFTKNANLINSNQNIQLLKETEEAKININENSIINFIKYCQLEPISLDNGNVVILNYLGHKYELPELIKHTEEYISTHHSDIALDQLVLHDDDNCIDKSTYENIISSHLLDYIDDSRMLQLKVSTLYRIIEPYFKRAKSGEEKNATDKESDRKVLDFVMKYVDKNGRNASVLLSCISFDEANLDFLNTLVREYSKKVDFHFINQDLLSSIYEHTNRIICDGYKIESLVSKLKEEETKNEELRKEVELLKNKLDSSMDEMSSKMESLKTENQRKIDGLVSEKLQMSQRIDSLQAENQRKIDSLQTENQRKIDGLLSELNNLKQKLAEIKEDQKNFKRVIAVPYSPDSSNKFNGILTRLGNGNAEKSLSDGVINIEQSSIASSKEKFQPKNILNYNTDNLCFCTKDESDSWLCIDFKNYKVKPSHYSIRSSSLGGKGYFHLQSWDLEGSNDFNKWDPLDSHPPDKSLDGESASNTFEIKEQNRNKFYRYIRLKLTGKNTSDTECLFLSCIEFYGQIEQ